MGKLQNEILHLDRRAEEIKVINDAYIIHDIWMNDCENCNLGKSIVYKSLIKRMKRLSEDNGKAD